MSQLQNLATDPEAVARYDEPGSCGKMSEGWVSTPYTIGKWLLCTKANVIPYGQYVVVGSKHLGGGDYDYSESVIRCASERLRIKLDEAYDGMFVKCLHLLKEEFE